MPTRSYKTSSKKKLFQNTPYRAGVNYTNLIKYENTAKAIINYDYANSGEYAYPRPPFVNSILSNGYLFGGKFNYDYTPKFTEETLIQNTNKGPRFLIGFEHTVDEYTYVNEEVGDDATFENIPLIEGSFGIQVGQLGNVLEPLNNVNNIITVEFVSNYDGDTAKFVLPGDDPNITENEINVRFLGIDTPEIGDETTTIDTEARDFVTSKLSNAAEIKLVFDDISEETDDGEPYVVGENRKLAYIVYKNDVNDSDYILLNAEIILYGYAYISMISSLYLYYSNINSAKVFAETGNYGLYGGLTLASNETVIANVTLPEIPVDVQGNFKFYKKGLLRTEGIHPTIYGNQSFYEENPIEFDFGVTLTEDIFIQILSQDYESREYEYTQVNKNIPNVNMPWRNAISFFGRVIENGKVRYRGLITLQYGKLNPEDNYQHYILLQEPKEINLGSMDLNDPYSMAYNALDDDPYVFEDLIGEDASGYLRPQVLGCVIYDVKPTNNPDAKVYKSFDGIQNAYVRPFFAIPSMTNVTNFKGIRARILFKDKPLRTNFKDGAGTLRSDKEGWFTIVEQGGEVKIDDFLDYINSETWSFGLYSGSALTIEMETMIENITTTTTPGGTADPVTTSFSKVAFLSEEDLAKDYDSYDITEYYNISAWIDLEPLENTTFVGVKEVAHLKITNRNTGESKEVKKVGSVFNSGTATYELVDNTTLSNSFENIRFSIFNVDSGISLNYDINTTAIIEKESWYSRAATQIIITVGKDTIDPKELFKEHDVSKATDMCLWEQYLILYGDHLGSTSIQFTERDEFNYAPFPYGQITFDSKVIHVHSHRNNLYVFCESGLWILHSGLTYMELLKTFAYSGISLDKSEKNTVISYGNSVFFMSDSKGYVIRSNYNVSSQDDVYVQTITMPVNDLLSAPKTHLRKRFANAYRKVINTNSQLFVNYHSVVVNENLYIIGSYEIPDENEVLMVMYIYNSDSKRWKLYDTNSGGFPIAHLSNSSIKSFDLILANTHSGGLLTYGTFIYELDESLGQTIGDVKAFIKNDNGDFVLANELNSERSSVQPIYLSIDTGNLTLNDDSKKKLRRIRVYLSDIQSEQVDFTLVPYADGVPMSNPLKIDTFIDDGDILQDVNLDITKVELQEQKAIVYSIDPTLFIDENVQLSLSTLTRFARLRLETKVNLIGRTLGFELMIPATEKFEIMGYTLIYKSLSSR